VVAILKTLSGHCWIARPAQNPKPTYGIPDFAGCPRWVSRELALAVQHQSSETEVLAWLAMLEMDLMDIDATYQEEARAEDMRRNAIMDADELQ
jgi:hypothetical protein